MKKLIILFLIGLTITNIHAMNESEKNPLKRYREEVELPTSPIISMLKAPKSIQNFQTIEEIANSGCYRLKTSTSYYTIFELIDSQTYQDLPPLIFTTLRRTSFITQYLLKTALSNTENKIKYHEFEQFRENENSLCTPNALQKLHHAVLCKELSKLLKQQLIGERSLKIPAGFSPKSIQKFQKMHKKPNPFIIDYLSSLNSLIPIAEENHNHTSLKYKPMHTIEAARTQLKQQLNQPVNHYLYSVGTPDESSLDSFIIDHQNNPHSPEEDLFEDEDETIINKKLLMRTPMAIIIGISKKLLKQKKAKLRNFALTINF